MNGRSVFQKCPVCSCLYRASASVLLLAFKMRQWDAGKKQGGTLQGGFLDFFRGWDPLTHFEVFAFCFMLKPWLSIDNLLTKKFKRNILISVAYANRNMTKAETVIFCKIHKGGNVLNRRNLQMEVL